MIAQMAAARSFSSHLRNWRWRDNGHGSSSVSPQEHSEGLHQKAFYLDLLDKAITKSKQIGYRITCIYLVCVHMCTCTHGCQGTYWSQLSPSAVQAPVVIVTLGSINTA